MGPLRGTAEAAFAWGVIRFPTHLDVLLAEPVSDEARLMALAFRSRDLHSELGAAMMKRSAEEGWSVAQFHYATRFLDRGGEEAMLWLAMAAAQGDAEAADMVKTEGTPAIRAEAERRLLAMPASLGTQLGKAARWCDRRPPSLPDDKRCRLHALEDHIICRLPRSTSEALGIAVFEETEAYARCRSRRLEGP